MFQDFTNNSDSSNSSKRLATLREKMRAAELDMYLLPHADEFQNEYLPRANQRLAWLTGFNGSAGYLIVTMEKAILFTDSRYTLQVRDQTDQACFEYVDLTETPPTKWVEDYDGKGNLIGFDPWCMTINQRNRFEKAAERAGLALKTTPNLIDEIWESRPPLPLGEVWEHPLEFAGQPATQKIDALKVHLTDVNADACLLNDPASVCWLFNIRGNDVVHNPVCLARALIRLADRPEIFIDPQKLTATCKEYLAEIAEIKPMTSLSAVIEDSCTSNPAFLCDPDSVPSILGNLITAHGGRVISGQDPVSLPRAIKNKTEINGSRAAHLRDGVAVTRFLAWLDSQKPGSLSEIDAATKLEELRAQTSRLMDSELREIAFDTISGAGANGAIVHYRVSEATNLCLEADTLYLNDSGGQYPDGTTDITRTITIGDPPATAMTDFTLVLKGHIAIARARFPKGTRGVDLDVLARSELWQNGKDYGHGTGHGVGSYLNVHEGPQSISRRGMVSFEPGMIVSNEPGYYKTGKYGIRIENLLLVTEPQPIDGGDTDMLGFETLTLAPIDRRLIDPALLNDDERIWINTYHAHVREMLSDHLNDEERDWLIAATDRIEVDA